ncbi:hypothetical protein AABB24_028500 [Solanum stoloniferum]|uniref:Uncharacterized protein n=1 Tax=Solanum stoloniferum TaxID=62892 RepID=A0ABD2S6T5_9SOLN
MKTFKKIIYSQIINIPKIITLLKINKIIKAKNLNDKRKQTELHLSIIFSVVRRNRSQLRPDLVVGHRFWSLRVSSGFAANRDMVCCLFYYSDSSELRAPRRSS